MKRIYLFALAAASILWTTACTKENNELGSTGRLSVRLTDAPFPTDLVAEANVTVFKVEARNKSMSETDSTATSEYVVLMEEEIPVNLLDLRNGVMENLADAEVPIGVYDLVRVYVRGVNVVLTDSTVYDLKVPSGEQSGIKVFIKPGITVTSEITSDLLLDFDVSRSFVPKGNINNVKGITGFNFKPVIKAANMTTTGTLAGLVSTIADSVATPVPGAQVSVIVADTVNTSAFTDDEGYYAIMGLEAGSYDVLVEKEGFQSETAEGVQITEGNKTLQNFELIAN